MAIGLMGCSSLGFSQPFSGADELGRILPQYPEVWGKRSDKQVGLFYFL